MNVFMIKLMDQFDKCSYTEFLLTVDNRLSDYAFVSGLATRIGTELFQYFQLGVSSAMIKSSERIYTNAMSN